MFLFLFVVLLVILVLVVILVVVVVLLLLVVVLLLVVAAAVMMLSASRYCTTIPRISQIHPHIITSQLPDYASAGPTCATQSHTQLLVGRQCIAWLEQQRSNVVVVPVKQLVCEACKIIVELSCSGCRAAVTAV